MMAIAFFLSVSIADSSATIASWPQIEAFEMDFHFDDASEASVDLTIRDTDGNPRYRLECNDHFYDGNPDFTFSGDFECMLESLYSSETVSTLFAYAEDQSADWESRAIFYAAHFMGDCKSSPYGGKPRTFRLRNMKIVLRIYDEKVVVEKKTGGPLADFSSFSFGIEVSRDSRADRYIADDVGREDLPIWFHRSRMCLEGL